MKLIVAGFKFQTFYIISQVTIGVLWASLPIINSDDKTQSSKQNGSKQNCLELSVNISNDFEDQEPIFTKTNYTNTAQNV